MKTASKIFTVAVFIFLYVPMLVLIIASFNSGADLVVFKGFTMDNYQSLFRDRVLLPLLLNSVIISVIASLVSTVLGTAATLGIQPANSERNVRAWQFPFSSSPSFPTA